jgi:K+-sensing histidine kinase KdpD
VRLLPYLASVLAVVVVGVGAHVLTRVAPLPHVSILFLVPVVMCAALWGLGPSVLAAVLSVGAESFFFYAPIFSFRVASAQEITDLAVFVGVAAITSRLAASLRARALEARQRQETLARMLAFNERLAAAGDAELAATIERELAAAREQAPGDAELLRAMREQAALATERARLRSEVDDARVRAQGETLREALLNSMSHDLQTPVAVILGSATALESLPEGAVSAAQRELVAAIRDESERLASHIDNVLDLTRIRAGQLAPRLELVELADIVDAALRRKRKALDRHTVRVSLPPDLPMLRIDLFLVEHAIANVLDNAAKYAPAGSTIEVAAREEEGSVIVEVTDRGGGIPDAERERIFEPFYRGAGRPAAGASGTGLGLAICRAFIEANGGAVSAGRTADGAGAVLRLRLPVPENVAETVAADE